MSQSATLKVTAAKGVGLLFVLIGCAALTTGYLGWREGPAQSAAPVVAHSAYPAKTPRIVITRTNKQPLKTARTRTPVPKQRQPRAAAPHKPADRVAQAPPAPAPSSWRCTIAWSSCLLLLGLTLVGYSLHERPKIVRSGADEMLNEPTPF